MNSYQEDERKGREIFSKNVENKGLKGLEYTEDRYCSYDGFLTGKTDLTAVFEIKNRDVPDEAYEDEWLLEEIKAKPLIEAAITSGYDMALYIVITRDSIRMWDLLTLSLNYETGYFTPTTATNYKKGSKAKSVAYLKENQRLCKIPRTDKS